MSAPPQPSLSRTAHIEDSEDDIEVLVFKNSGRANNTINTTTFNTNNEQSDKPTVHTRLKRLTPKPSQKPLAAENRMARAGSHEKSSSHHDPHTHKSSDLSTGRQSLFGGPFGSTNDSIFEEPESIFEDESDDNLVNDLNFLDEMNTYLLDNTATSTSPAQSPARPPTQPPAQPSIPNTSRSATPTRFHLQTPARTPTQTPHTSSSKVTKSNPSHIALFNTLSPSQSLGRKRKLTSIRNKLKAKTCEELHEIYNSTDDPDFRKLMSEVYYENCMERLDDWERKL
ncbi:hypothetical protein KCU65_g7422, partial [Aureobasidium melanogenum]